LRLCGASARQHREPVRPPTKNKTEKNKTAKPRGPFRPGQAHIVKPPLRTSSSRGLCAPFSLEPPRLRRRVGTRAEDRLHTLNVGRVQLPRHRVTSGHARHSRCFSKSRKSKIPGHRRRCPLAGSAPKAGNIRSIGCVLPGGEEFGGRPVKWTLREPQRGGAIQADRARPRQCQRRPDLGA